MRFSSQNEDRKSASQLFMQRKVEKEEKKYQPKHQRKREVEMKLESPKRWKKKNCNEGAIRQKHSWMQQDLIFLKSLKIAN